MLKNKLFQCNLSLLIISTLTLISCVVLEVTPFRLSIAWIHAIVSFVWSAFVFYHIVLHWGGVKKWLSEISKLKLKMTKSLTYFFFIVFLSGIIATISIAVNKEHGMAGGIHGKFGMILIVLMMIHIIKRRKWYKGGKTGIYFTPYIDKNRCVKCKRCIKHCPANVLACNEKELIISAPEYCFACKKCIEVCSKNAIS